MAAPDSSVSNFTLLSSILYDRQTWRDCDRPVWARLLQRFPIETFDFTVCFIYAEVATIRLELVSILWKKRRTQVTLVDSLSDKSNEVYVLHLTNLIQTNLHLWLQRFSWSALWKGIKKARMLLLRVLWWPVDMSLKGTYTHTYFFFRFYDRYNCEEHSSHTVKKRVLLRLGDVIYY